MTRVERETIASDAANCRLALSEIMSCDKDTIQDVLSKAPAAKIIQRKV